MIRPPIKLFFSYAHEDQIVRDELDVHLDILEREGLVTAWWDGDITAGSRWNEAIEKHLRASHIVVFLISDKFFESEFIAANELPIALDLQKASDGVHRVICVMTQPTPAFARSPLKEIQRVPPGKESIAERDDRARALEEVVVEIRRAALDIIIAGGGPFDFGPHAFTRAELARLEPDVRDRASKGLRRLRSTLVDSVPRRVLDKNLLVANWCLARFGRRPVLPETLIYMAQVISAFDIVSLQEVSRDLGDLRALINILGPEWGFVITDVTLGRVGHDERFAILYYRPRVTFEHVSGGIVLPEDSLVDGRQFARTPLLASFRTADVPFRVCSTHIRFGKNRRESLAECETMAALLSKLATRSGEEIVLTGNFNLHRDDSPALAAFRDSGATIPEFTLHPTLWRNGQPCDLIGYLASTTDRAPRLKAISSGLINTFQHVFRDQDLPEIREAIEASWQTPESDTRRPPSNDAMLRAIQLSDHLPFWVEYEISGSADD